MKHLRLSALATVASTLLFSQLSYAAAFQLYELGTPVIGTAGVGQAALANDASTAYFNPAGMALLPSTELMLGSQIILPYINFSPSGSTTITGNNGSNAGILTPGLGGYYVYNLGPKWKIGISLTQPFGGALSYNNHWVGRYNVQQMVFYTLNLNPSISYDLTQWLALGLGVSLEYANLYQTVALGPVPVPGTAATVDGQITIKANNFSPGFNLGLLLSPTDCTKIGLAYRSQIVHNLSGTVDFLNLTATPSVTTKMVMPTNVIGSLSQQLGDKFTVLGELGWANWQSMKDSILYVAGFTAITPQNWNNTYRAGLGGQFQYSSALLVQAGASYDSSPTSTSKRLPNLPMDRQIRAGIGLEYALIKKATLGLSYEYINFGNANINNTSTTGTLAGNYTRNYANVFQASLNVAV